MARSKNLEKKARKKGVFVSTLLQHVRGGLTSPVLARTFGTGYEAIEGGRDGGRQVDQGCTSVYCL